MSTDQITCSITGETRETKVGKNGPKLPRGWKRWQGQVFSKAAWGERFCVRTIYLPVRKPCEGEWKDLREQLHEAWAHATSATKWAYLELLKNDVVRTPDMPKMPAMPRIYLYGMGRWNGWANSANCTLRLCEQTYRKRRYDIVWRGNASLPNSKYPQPFLIHEANWSAREHECGLSVSIPLVGRRVEFLVKTHRHERAANTLRRVIAGEIKHGEAKIYMGKKGDVMFAAAVWLPIETTRNKSGRFFVRTDPQSFLVALDEKDERLWVLNGDECRRWLIQRDKAVQRMSEDLKFERRPKTRRELERSRQCSQKQRDRILTFAKQSAAYVAGYATRRRIAEVVYDGNDKSYFRKFPWHEFETCLRNACERSGVAFTAAATRDNTKSKE